MASVAHLQNFVWQKGQSGNPAGRPKGSRSKLEETFLKDLYESWQLNGSKVLERVVEDDPVAYLKVVASLMKPKDTSEEAENTTRDRVKRAIETIESWIAAGGPPGDGPITGDGGAEVPATPAVQTLPEAGSIP